MLEPHYEKGEWYRVQMEEGHTFWMPSYQFDSEPTVKDIEQFCGLPYVSHEKISGWGARMYDAGDGDCTDWVVFDTPDEARGYLEREGANLKRAGSKNMTPNINTHNLEAEDLDELVHEMKSREAHGDTEEEMEEALDIAAHEASAINNSGLEGQVQYLLECLGAESFQQELDQLHESR